MGNDKPKNIFDHIRAITEIQDNDYLTTLSPAEYKEFNIFLLQKYLGLHNDLTYAISYIDKYVFLNKMSKEHYYKLLISIIPKYDSKKFWIKFPKKDKIEIPPTWFLDLIKDYFKYISTQDAIEYYKFFSNETKSNVLKIYGISQNKLDELI